jgi:hypothetical protein
MDPWTKVTLEAWQLFLGIVLAAGSIGALIVKNRRSGETHQWEKERATREATDNERKEEAHARAVLKDTIDAWKAHAEASKESQAVLERRIREMGVQHEDAEAIAESAGSHIKTFVNGVRDVGEQHGDEYLALVWKDIGEAISGLVAHEKTSPQDVIQVFEMDTFAPVPEERTQATIFLLYRIGLHASMLRGMLETAMRLPEAALETLDKNPAASLEEMGDLAFSTITGIKTERFIPDSFFSTVREAVLARLEFEKTARARALEKLAKDGEL